ncbi:MAG TPA: hypothetical protein VJQ57_02545, partial [Acidimicrobiia bacterium]|nr:hypothetical protein [Acidimicrobiia bacterium]
MSTFLWPSLAYSLLGPIVINGAAQVLGWDDRRTGISVAIFLGLLMVRGRIDRAAILLAGLAELIFLSDPWVYWVAVPLTFLVIAWWATAGNSAAIAALRITPRSDRAVTPEAQSDVDRYLARDYEIVASSDVSGEGFATIFTYLLSSDRAAYAVATDRVRCIASAFGDRVLVTISHVNSIVHPRELRQWVHEDSMTVTMDAHTEALAALAALGHQPDRLRPEDVLPFSIGVDEASKACALGHRWEYFRSCWSAFSGCRCRTRSESAPMREPETGFKRGFPNSSRNLLRWWIFALG